MDFTEDRYSAPMAIEKIKILGALLEIPAKQHCQSSPFTSKLGQIGSAVQLVAPIGLPGFDFFNCHGCLIFILCEIHCYQSAHIFWLYYFSFSQCLPSQFQVAIDAPVCRYSNAKEKVISISQKLSAIDWSHFPFHPKE